MYTLCTFIVFDMTVLKKNESVLKHNLVDNYDVNIIKNYKKQLQIIFGNHFGM